MRRFRPKASMALPPRARRPRSVQDAVEQKFLTPLEGARLISSIAATLFGYDEFILREISPESLLAGPAARR
jgi:hypothetical protein